MQMLYNQEAAVWEEALPLGNGRIGAMVWSGVGTEKISLNDDTLWSGYPKTLNLPDKQHHFHAARALAMQGKYRQAQDYIEANMQGSYTQGYLPLCDMVLEMEDDTATEYNRVLDLNNAVVSLEYCQNKIRYKREYFVSAPDQVMVMRLSADVAGAISFAAQFTCQLNANATAEYNRLKLDGIAPSVARPLYHMGDEPIVYDSTPDKQGMRFAAIADFEVSGGETFADQFTNIENTLVIGQNTFGMLTTSSGTPHYLPNSGMPVSMGRYLLLHPENTWIEGVGFEPDIWVVGNALNAAFALISGME